MGSMADLASSNGNWPLVCTTPESILAPFHFFKENPCCGPAEVLRKSGDAMLLGTVADELPAAEGAAAPNWLKPDFNALSGATDS